MTFKVIGKTGPSKLVEPRQQRCFGEQCSAKRQQRKPREAAAAIGKT